jgi:hypothetical protein
MNNMTGPGVNVLNVAKPETNNMNGVMIAKNALNVLRPEITNTSGMEVNVPPVEKKRCIHMIMC